jgi:hypothetical protein
VDFAPDQRVRVRQRPDLPPGTVTRTVRFTERQGLMVWVLHDDGALRSWWARDLAPVVPELPPELL